MGSCFGANVGKDIFGASTCSFFIGVDTVGMAAATGAAAPAEAGAGIGFVAFQFERTGLISPDSIFFMQSRQYTGRPGVGSNGSDVALPHEEHTA